MEQNRITNNNSYFYIMIIVVVIMGAIIIPVIDEKYSKIDRTSKDYALYREAVLPMFSFTAKFEFERISASTTENRTLLFPREIVVNKPKIQYRFPYELPEQVSNIQYVSNGKWFLFIHPGPDDKYNNDFIQYVVNKKDELTTFSLSEQIAKNIYDPTNGYRSTGDLIFPSTGIGNWDHKMLDSYDKAILKKHK